MTISKQTDLHAMAFIRIDKLETTPYTFLSRRVLALNF
jgi:hypothetical protein